MTLQKCGLNTNNTQQELQPHGSIDFPCAGYASIHQKDFNDVIAWHWHDEIEIIYIEKGSLIIQIPSKQITLLEGEMVIINSHVLHFARTDSYCKLNSLVFSKLLLTGNNTSSFAKKYIDPLLSCPHFKYLKILDNKMILSFLNAFKALKNDTFAYEFTVREELSHILLYCFKSYEKNILFPKVEENRDEYRLETMLDYIHNHYFENITLADISLASNIGERECLRCFKRTIGISPIQYLLKYRLMQSANLLLSNPSWSIVTIANACGFDYASYYSKQFKKYYLCSPKEYRKIKSL